MKRILLALCALCATVAIAQTANPAVTQENISKTICVSGWTATVRPPVSYTNTIKRRYIKLKTGHAATAADMAAYELDHIIPLAAGGHPTNTSNLQLQLWDGPDGAKAKDIVEVRVKRLICVKRITLAQGQQCFRDGWQTCPKK